MSCDSLFSHVAWQKFEVGSLNFPLGSDYWPHGEVARSYGVFRPGDPLPGINERAVFIIDREGIIRSISVLELGEVQDNEDAFEVLRQVQAKTGASKL